MRSGKEKGYRILIDDIEIHPYYDLVAAVGRKGSGKSFLAKVTTQLTPRVVVVDPNHEYKKLDDETVFLKDVTQLRKHVSSNFFNNRKEYQVVVQHNELNETILFYICEQIKKYCTDTLLVVEELGRYDSLRTHTENPFKNLVDFGRHKGIGIFATARRIVDIPPYMRNSLDTLFAFPTANELDVKLIDSYFSSDVMIELKRLYKSNPEKYMHYFAYNNMNEKIKIHPTLRF